MDSTKEPSINVQQTLPFPQSQIKPKDTTEWARILALVKPATTPSTTNRNVLLHLPPRTDESLSRECAPMLLGYVSEVPDALIQGKVQAWAWSALKTGRDTAGVVTEALLDVCDSGPNTKAEVIIVVKSSGHKRCVRVQDAPAKSSSVSCVVLEAANSTEAELFVNILSEMKASGTSQQLISRDAVMDVVEQLASSTTSVLVLLSNAPTASEDEAPSKLLPRCSTQSYDKQSKSTTASQTIGSVDALVRGLMHQLCEDDHHRESELGRGQRAHIVHTTSLNGLSPLESWIIQGAVHKADGIVVTRLGGSRLPHLDCPNRGFGIAAVTVRTNQFPFKTVSLESVPQGDGSHGPSQASWGPSSQTSQKLSVPNDITMSPKSASSAQLEGRIQAACRAVMAAEAEITKYDTLTGDGDCGLTLSAGARRVLEMLAALDLSPDSLVVSIQSIVDELENAMGGTSGALYCIFLASLAEQLARPDQHKPDDDAPTRMAAALLGAMHELFRFTKARAGDRTCIDALSPFVTTLAAGGTEMQACEAAEKGAQATAQMTPNVGRASYLRTEACMGVPDAGAFGLTMLLKGFCLDALQSR